MLHPDHQVRKLHPLDGISRFVGRIGSPCVSEIELKREVRAKWPNIMKWLNNLDLLKVVGLERLDVAKSELLK